MLAHFPDRANSESILYVHKILKDDSIVCYKKTGTNRDGKPVQVFCMEKWLNNDILAVAKKRDMLIVFHDPFGLKLDAAPEVAS